MVEASHQCRVDALYSLTNISEENDVHMTVTNSIRIVMLSSYPPSRGGISEYTAYLVRGVGKALEGKGRLIAVCSSTQSSVMDICSTVSIVRFRSRTPLDFVIRTAITILRLKANIVHIQFPPDVEQWTGPLGESLSICAFLIRLMGKKIIISDHAVWTPKSACKRALRYARIQGVANLLEWYFRLHTVFILSLANVVIVFSNYAGSVLAKHYGIDPNKIIVLPHGLSGNSEAFDQDKASARLDLQSRHIILCFGHIWPNKGLELGIEATRLLRDRKLDVTLLIVGPLHPTDGPSYLSSLKELISSLQIQAWVRIVPTYVPERDIPIHFSAASLVLLPYTEVVGPSGVLNLAFSFGKPVVATNLGQRAEDLAYGKLGLLVRPDAGEIAQAIYKLLTDRNLKDRLLNAVQQYRIENDWDNVGRLTVCLYEHILHHC